MQSVSDLHPMADQPLLRSPRALADALRAATPSAVADLLVAVDTRIAGLALVALHDAENDDWDRSEDQKAADRFVELLLIIKYGLFDHAISTQRGPRSPARPLRSRSAVPVWRQRFTIGKDADSANLLAIPAPAHAVRLQPGR